MRDALAKPSTQADSIIDQMAVTLTSREREVAALLAKSNSSKEVGARLNISTKTAENHLTNLIRNWVSMTSLGLSASSSGRACTTPTARAKGGLASA